MLWLASKYLVTAAIVVLVSELARRHERIGALVAALPLVTVLALVWMQIERQPPQRIADFAAYTFWYVLPSLPMFVVFPLLLPRVGFWGALLLSASLAVLCFFLLALVLKRFDITLL